MSRSIAPERRALVERLRVHRCADAAERHDRDGLLALLASTADPFSRATLPVHCTASAWILDAAGASTVLVHHRKLNCWVQPGGHPDGDPDLAATALREAREETGLTSLVALDAGAIYDVALLTRPAYGAEPAHAHYDVRYRFVADPAETPRCSAESYAARWAPLTDLARLGVDETVLRLARKGPATEPPDDADPGSAKGLPAEA